MREGGTSEKKIEKMCLTCLPAFYRMNSEMESSTCRIYDFFSPFFLFHSGFIIISGCCYCSSFPFKNKNRKERALVTIREYYTKGSFRLPYKTIQHQPHDKILKIYLWFLWLIYIILLVWIMSNDSLISTLNIIYHCYGCILQFWSTWFCQMAEVGWFCKAV